MIFTLPCADTLADTRLSVCEKPMTTSASPSASNSSLSTTQNTTDVDGESSKEAVECVLTMASCWDHDDKAFLRSKIYMLEGDVYAKATKVMNSAAWKLLRTIVDQTKDVGCLKVTTCGHQFAGLPLLYAFLTTGFKCPICRFGGNVQIDISAKVPDGMCPKMWMVLCVLCDVVRKRDRVERNHDTHFSTLQLARQTITVVYQTLPWVVRFVLYKDANPGMNSQPFAQIPIHMTIDRSALHARQGVWPDNIELSAGVRGSSARSLTAQMRKCASFFVEIVIDIETTRHIIFQSNKMVYKRAPLTMDTQTCYHTEHTIGCCRLDFEKCSYQQENFLQKVTFSVAEVQLRALIIGIAGLL